MQRDHALAAAAGLLVALMVTSVVFVPGVLAEPRDDVRPSYLSINEGDSTISVDEVGGETVTLRLDTRLVHDGGLSENVTMEVQARDAESGLLADSTHTSVGDVSGERTRSVLTNLTVEREGGYDLRTIVYEDGDRKAGIDVPIRGVEALQPGYADSPVRFQRYESSGTGVPTVSYNVESSRDGRTRLNVSAALINGGDEPAGDVTVRLRARQADSNIIADQTRVDVGSIRPGRTVEATGLLDVPGDYNYWLDAVLMKDGVVLGTASEPAHLDPSQRLQRNETREEVEFSAGDFTENRETDSRDRGESSTTVGGSGPGFGVAGALGALVAAALLFTRRYDT